MGTPDFISPEQAADSHQADIRSDIYSLGASLHYLLCGQPPFAVGSVAERLRSHAETEPVSVNSLRDDVPQELAGIVSRMMAKEPNQRLQTPQGVADALASFVDRDRNVATAEGTPLVVNKKSWRAFSKLAAMACAAFGLVLAGIIYLETDKGTLAIESVDDSVIVTISKAKNSDGDSYLAMGVVDTVTGSSVKSLPSGDYKVSLGKAGNEFELSPGDSL
jgi:serine/threonine protein kinase